MPDRGFRVTHFNLRTRRTLSAAVWLACSLVPAAARELHPETGNFLLEKFAPKVYGASPQNWAVLQDQRGIMYFGNTEGLVEFDGVQWRRIALPNASTVRSLAMDSKGTIFIGGQGELGYLAPDAQGNAQFVSLLEKLPAEDRKFGEVWSIAATADGVYFSSTGRLMRWRPKEGMRTWKLTNRFRRAYLIDDVLHVQVTSVGLHRLQNDKLELIPGGEKLENIDMRGVFRHGASNIVATQKGCFRITRTGLEPFSFAADAALKEASLYTLNQLNNDLLALGTLRGGLILTNTEGKILRTITKDNGLPSEYITSSTVDRQNGVWLTTSNGLARFQLYLTAFDEQSGLRGTLMALTRWKDTIYAGTTSGLFRLQPGKGAAPPQFEAVEGIKEAVFSLVVRPGELWIATQGGLYSMPADIVKKEVKLEVAYDVAFSPRNDGVLYVASRTGGLRFRREGAEWKKAGEVSAAGQEFRTVAEDEDGRVWFTTRSGILRADFDKDPATVETFSEADGLAPGWKNLFRIRGQLRFATEKGLVRFTGGTRKFVPDDSIGGIFADGSHGVLLMKEDGQRNVWISGAGYHGVTDISKNWRPMPFLAAGLDEIWALQADRDGVVWASGPDGRLIRREQAPTAGIEPFRIQIRRLQAAETRHTMFGGFGRPIGNLEVPQGENDLRVEFAAPFYDAPERVEYQVSIDTAGGRWSGWTNETWKDLNNLWEGNYQLRVRARNPYGQMTPEASIFIRILAPWYRTWWAYMLYVIAVATVIWMLLQWRLRKLRERNQRLEALVDERTAQIRAQEQRTEALLLNILPAPVAEELRSTGEVTPHHFDDVTVCFTDFVGFTLSSENLPAKDLVAHLHRYFTEFDKIVARYGLEKLKTIGDAYMFVAGLPEENESHAVNAVLAAMEILACAMEISAAEGGMPWKLRVGLHSGPVVAGVVGVKKFAFDIWGDTVNLASRMESSGVPNRVNISAATYARVKDVIACEARGLVRTKDGRDLAMYFANGLAVQPAAGQTSRFGTVFEKPPEAL